MFGIQPTVLAKHLFAVAWFCLTPLAVCASDLDFFERKIRPVLVERCYECHSADSEPIQGGLRVDHPTAFLQGGDSGSALKPGLPQESPLLAALRYDGMEMPPDEPLDAETIEDFERWIRDGAPLPNATDSPPLSPGAGETSLIEWDTARQFWSFAPPQLHPPARNPSEEAKRWNQNSIDAHVWSKLDEHGLRPNAEASKRTWIRRVSIDLVGLPPTVSEIDAFLADSGPNAKRKVVDRLLSDPCHAERWTRLWLDVARYAEDQAHVVGNNDSLTYPNAYQYRDWVIQSLAADMPYDEFIRMQLAADQLNPEQLDSHIALGFLGLGPKYYRRGDPEVMADEWEDRVDTVSRGLLGLTVACARCHDHKYDPIPTSDYYALAGVFASTEMFNRPLNDQVEKKGDEAKKPQDAVHIVREGKPRDLPVMIRGDVHRPGDIVQRGFLTVLAPQGETPVRFQSGSGRIELANAIANPDNPLTARVMVNRVWNQLMGAPLVDTLSNFGALGSLPTHPELLDDLAVQFVQSGWSLKRLQREIVLSATYGQSSLIDEKKYEIDPDNQWRWRMPVRRMSLEAYRDAVLHVCDRLDDTVGGRSIDPDDQSSRRRTVYSRISRLDLNPMLARFDFPDPNAHSAGRHETTTPLQKLFLLNSEFMTHHARALAERLQAECATDASRIELAYRMLFGREPSETERKLAQDFLIEAPESRWIQLSQALLISNEMFMLD